MPPVLLLSLIASTNLTDVLSGTWNVTAIEVANGASPTPGGYYITLQAASAQPGNLSGALYAKNPTGDSGVKWSISISPGDSPHAFALEIAEPDSESRLFAELAFRYGIRGVFTASGAIPTIGNFSIVLSNSTFLEATVFNSKENATTPYRCVKNVSRQKPSFWVVVPMLIPLVPMFLMICMCGSQMVMAPPSGGETKKD
jgi:hypothetical protein